MSHIEPLLIKLRKMTSEHNDFSEFWEKIPSEWQALCQPQRRIVEKLEVFLQQERQEYTIFPKYGEIFQALKLCSPENVRVIILGQDPYHDDNQAHGLAFSVKNNIAIPPSLRNIFKELVNDLGIPMPSSGDLTPWAKQGVLLLNSVLTVRAHQAFSHQKQGWEEFTDGLLFALSQQQAHLVFILWGNAAGNKEKLLEKRHSRLKTAHPSPLSASRGFFGSRPFSFCNQKLQEHGQEIIDWRLD
jgi:uracil-DNA glycosylase